MRLSAAQRTLISMMPVGVPVSCEEVREFTHKEKILDALVNKGLVERCGDRYLLAQPINDARHFLPNQNKRRDLQMKYTKEQRDDMIALRATNLKANRGDKIICPMCGNTCTKGRKGQYSCSNSCGVRMRDIIGPYKKADSVRPRVASKPTNGTVFVHQTSWPLVRPTGG